MKHKKITFAVILLILPFFISAQTWEEEKEKMQKKFAEHVKQTKQEFNNYFQQQQKEYKEFVQKTDSAYSKFLSKTYKEYNLFAGIKPEKTPKPDNIPVFVPTKKEKTIKKIPVKAFEKIIIPKPIIKPVIRETSQDESIELKTQPKQINFYGSEIFFRYDKNFIKSPLTKINEKTISDFWNRMSQTEYEHFISQMQDYKIEMNLNDWGYYLLLKKTSEKIFAGSENQSELFVWYMLSKSGYKVRVGYNNNKVYLLIPSFNTLYGVKYYTFNNLRYYAINLDAEKIFTYKKDYPEANLIMDFNIRNPLNIGNAFSEKTINFNYYEKKHFLKIKYNTNSVEFYKDYPVTDLKVYFDAAISHIAKESITENLYPLIKAQSETEAVNLLLNFVQTSFKYKTDQEYLGKEKFYFPEEVFYYQYSDCEDRAVLFACLVKNLLNLEVIGLKYKGHIATAVKFDEDVSGDYFIYKGQKYIVCDPTYLNAPLGMSMPQFAYAKADIIELENIQHNKKLKDKIWASVLASGGNHGSNKKDIVFDKSGNSYVTGYFNEYANFGKYNLKSTDNTNDIFLAKYDKTGKVIWAKQSGGNGNDIAYNITLDKNDNCYITGSYDRTAVFGDKILNLKENSDVFIAKYSQNGNLLWANKAGIDNIYNDVNFNFLAKYDCSGNHQWTRIYNETENYANQGISIDSLNNCYLSGSFYALSGIDIDVLSFNEYSEFDKIKYVKSLNDKLIANGYNKAIAGLVAAINFTKTNGNSISGETIQKALNKYNPEFKNTSPNIYKRIGGLQFLKNLQGIITIKTEDSKDVSFDKIKIKNNSKIKTIEYKSGNIDINILSGINVGKAIIWYDLNYIRLYKKDGNLLFDYHDDTQKTLNLKKDILD